MYGFRNSSFTKEQLTSLGITKDINSVQQFNSRPFFPVSASKPLEIESNVAIDYKVLFKEDYRSRLHEIHDANKNNGRKIDTDTYSLQIANALEKEHKKKLQFTLATKLMPAELNSQTTSKRKAKTPALKPTAKKRMVKDVVKHLDDLAKNEENLKENEEESDKADSEAEVENEEVEDPELDEETDYDKNYFDNGENYSQDEDDALDDGPIF